MVEMIMALISGALMSIQGVLNTGLTKQTSLWLANSWVQGTAWILCMGVWMVKEKQAISSLFRVEPRYLLFGGVIGAFITLTVILSMGSLGPAKAALLIVVSQIVVAYVIELFGILGAEKAVFQWRKCVGLVVAIIGILIFKWE